jgi:hypothetical protein
LWKNERRNESIGHPPTRRFFEASFRNRPTFAGDRFEHLRAEKIRHQWSRTSLVIIGVDRLEKPSPYYLVQVFGLSSVAIEHAVNGWNVLEQQPFESRTAQRRSIHDLLEDYLQPNHGAGAPIFGQSNSLKQEPSEKPLERFYCRWSAEKDRIVSAIAALLESPSKRGPKKGMKRARATGKRRGRMTPEGRRRLSLAMKKRWAKRRRKKS